MQISPRYSRREGLLALFALPSRRLGLLQLIALLPVEGLELLLVFGLEVVHGCVWIGWVGPKNGKATRKYAGRRTDVQLRQD